MLNTFIPKMEKMKSQSGKFLFLFAAGIFLLSLAGCGNQDDDSENTDVPQGMVAADLSAHGLPILITVPDSTTAQLQVTENAQGGADVRVGKNIQITIIEGPGDIALKKNDITHDDIRKFIKYIVEEENALIWEWQIEGMEPEFHFYAIIKSGGKSFEVHDVEGEMFSEKAALQMLEAAKSIRLKESPKAES